MFAAGDVRHESVKRVASAVGEGSVAVHFIHRYLASSVGARLGSRARTTRVRRCGPLLLSADQPSLHRSSLPGGRHRRAPAARHRLRLPSARPRPDRRLPRRRASSSDRTRWAWSTIRSWSNAAAEIGVILLLFTIGIEFSLERLRAHQDADLRRRRPAGRAREPGDHRGAAGAVRRRLARGALHGVSGRRCRRRPSCSSCSADRGETAAPYGQVSLGLLIFQDLAIIVMVLLVPMLGGAGGSSCRRLRSRWPRRLAIILVVLVVARRLMPPLLERVALHLLAGAVPADGHRDLLRHGLADQHRRRQPVARRVPRRPVVSESRFSHHAFGEIMPLQILFSATFFVSVGMLLDVGFLVAHLPLVLAAVALVCRREGRDHRRQRSGPRLSARPSRPPRR